MVAAGLRQTPQQRIGTQGQSHSGLPQGQLQGAVQDPRESPVQSAQPRQTPGPLAESALHRSGEVER